MFCWFLSCFLNTESHFDRKCNNLDVLHRLSLLRSYSPARLSRFTCWWQELWRDGGILQPKGHCLRPHYCLRCFIIPRISHKRTHLCFSLHFISSVCLCRPFSFSQKMELFILLSRSVHLATDNVAHRREECLSLSFSSQSHCSCNAQAKNACPYWRYKKKHIKPENKEGIAHPKMNILS